MKNILCFGDSLTWGFNPTTFARYTYEERWTGMLQKKLGNEYRIIDEGLNGRTTVFDDKFLPYRNGGTMLPMLLETHTPLDLVIIMLGTNDLKPCLHLTAAEVARGAGVLLMHVMKSLAGPDGKSPKSLLLAPPWLDVKENHPMSLSFTGAEAESQALARHYQKSVELYKSNFLDTAKFLKTSQVDGVHLDVEGNAILAEQLAPKIIEICGAE